MTGMESESTRSNRIELRATPHEKALLARAAALEHLDVTSFIMRTVVPAARKVIQRTEHMELSGQDTIHVLHLLENPPLPNAKLRAAAKARRASQTE